MSAAIGRDTVDRMRAAVGPYDTAERRAAYRAGDYPRADVTRDVDKRYRWDCLWCAVDAGALSFDTFAGFKDAHVDTALRSIVGPLGDAAEEVGRAPDPDCYACQGTGRVRGFGMSGAACPCLDVREEA